MFDYMEKHSIKNIIQTGDLFDRRKEVHFNTLYNANKYFFDPMIAHNITMFVICGNHDSLFKSSNYINSVSLLKKDNWVVVDMVPQTIVIDGRQIDMYPWIND
jgi:DNA repair exonuclease SbcCD nuclease subunit